MKTRMLACLALALVLGACQKESKKNATLPEESAGLPEILAEVESGQESRSTVAFDEHRVGTILWTPYDEINVFFGSEGFRYVSQNSQNAANAVFRSTDEGAEMAEGEADNIWGLYPYDRDAVCDGASVTTTLPGTQRGVPETFDDDLFITLAHSTTNTLKFFNVCGGVRFSLTRSDIASVTFKGNNGEDIAGDISLAFVDGAPKATVVNGLQEITLTPRSGRTFEKDVNYCIVVLPVTLSGGFTITFTTENGTVAEFEYTDKPITIKRSTFGRKADFDSYSSFVGFKTLHYTTSDGQPLNLRYPDSFGAAIESHTYENGVGTITFEAPVNAIGDNAFSGCNTLTSIDLPEGLKSIGQYAFDYCSGLTSLTIPSTVTSIAFRAFEGCTGLTSMYIPDSVAALGNQLFVYSGVSSVSLGAIVETKTMNSPLGGCQNLSVTVREGVSTIGENAFSNCSYMTSVTLPESLTSINRYAFNGCSGLTSLAIPAGVTSIGEGAFRSCTGLTTLNIPSGVTSIESSLFSSCTGLTSVTLPEGLTSIGQYAFDYCSGLTSLTIPSTVTSIAYRAFEGCSGLTSMYIPDSVTELGSQLFVYTGVTSVSLGAIVETKTMNTPLNGCQNLSVMVREGVSTIGENAFSNCSYMTSVTLPESLTSINRYAFNSCSGLTSLTIPAGVTSIGEGAFRSCTGLTTLVIPSGVTSLETSLFSSCTGLTSITLPEGLTSIGESAFSDCRGLTSLTIPGTVTSLGYRAFQYCTGLTEFKCLPVTPPSAGSGLFYQASECPIYVPAASVEAYQTADNWKTYAARIQAML